MSNNVAVITQTNGVIKCDFDRARAYLRDRLDEYRGIQFTEESKTIAKKTVASLRSEKKEFTDRVRAVKAEYMKPFDAFYAEAVSLIDMYDEPINYINGQIIEFEEKRIEEKKCLIRQIYSECIGDMSDFLPLDKIYNPKWENATTNQSAIRKEILTRMEDAQQAIKTIKEMRSDVEEYALNMYRETFDISKCIMYITQHEKQKAEILAREQERVRREEMERIRMEEREKLEAERRAQEEKEALLRKAEEEKRIAVEAAKEEASQELVESLIPDVGGESSLYEYRISLTEDAKQKLEMYMDSVGIEWELM